jgi:SAM-dependent methyltransferase
MKRDEHRAGGREVEWWQDGGGFFGKPYMEGDDSIEGFRAEPMSLLERTRSEVEGIINLLGLAGRQRVLDVPCGYGRHSNELARRGFDVVGVDINREELAVARRSSVGGAGAVRFETCDMRDIRYREEFDVVLNLFFSFGFFESDEDNDGCIRRFHEALRPGGRFVMHTDVHIPRLLRGEHKFQETRSLRSGRVLRIDERFDAGRCRIEGTWTLQDPDGSSIALRRYSQRVYTYDEFAEKCRAAGFGAVRGWADWDGGGLEDTSDMMIIVATK